MADTNNNNKIAQAVESTWAKGFARVLTPLLLSLIAYLGIEVRSDIREALRLAQQNVVHIEVLKAKVEALEKNNR